MTRSPAAPPPLKTAAGTHSRPPRRSRPHLLPGTAVANSHSQLTCSSCEQPQTAQIHCECCPDTCSCGFPALQASMDPGCLAKKWKSHKPVAKSHEGSGWSRRSVCDGEQLLNKHSEKRGDEDCNND